MEQSAQVCGVIQAASVDLSALGIAPIVLTLAPASTTNAQVITSQTNEVDQPAAQLVDAEAFDQTQNVPPEPISEETIAPEETGIARAPEEGTTSTEQAARPGSSEHGLQHPGSFTAEQPVSATTTDEATESTLTPQLTSPATAQLTSPVTAQLTSPETPRWTSPDNKNRTHECTICGKRLTAKKHLVTHIKRIHEKLKPYECPVCQRCFASNGDLTRHKATVHVSDKLHNCSICSKAFKTDELMRKHVREVHVDDRLHRCDDCKKAYKTERSLRKHLGIVHGQATFSFQQCPQCGVRVSGHRALVEHQTTVHEQQLLHECGECGRKFKRISQVNRHRLAVHSKLKPHKCSVCEKAFAVKTYLTRHMMTVHWEGEEGTQESGGHEESDTTLTDGDESMDVGASFVENQENNGEGTASEQSGSGQSPTKHPGSSHSCEDCDKVLKSKELLRQHQAVVHGKGKFQQCDDCTVRVRGQAALLEHQKAVHGKEKPNQCRECGKHFTRMRDVKRHQMIVHLKKKPYQCDGCDKSFSRRTDMIKHKQANHKDSIKEGAMQQGSKQEAPAGAEGQATSVPVTEEVTRSMESLVDLLVLASEINAGMGGVNLAVKEGLLQLQKSVDGQHEEVTLEVGVQPTPVIELSGASADMSTQGSQSKDDANGWDTSATDQDMDTTPSQGGSTAGQPTDEVTDKKDDNVQDQQLKDKSGKEQASICSDQAMETEPAAQETAISQPAVETSDEKRGEIKQNDKAGDFTGASTIKDMEDDVPSQKDGQSNNQHRQQPYVYTETGIQEQSLEVHSKQPVFQCDQCDKKYARTKDLQRHKSATHNAGHPLKCPECNNGYSKIGFLTRHRQTVHGKEPQAASDVTMHVDKPEESVQKENAGQELMDTTGDLIEHPVEGFVEEIEATTANEEPMDTSGKMKAQKQSVGSAFIFRPTPDIKASRRRLSKQLCKKVSRMPVTETSSVRIQKASRLDKIVLSLSQSQQGNDSEQQ